MKANLSTYLTLLMVVLVLAGCRKSIEIYEIKTVEIESENLSKSRIKGEVEFVSIAYRDLFGTAISPSKVKEIGAGYLSFGDKVVMADMLILNLLNDPAVDVPSSTEMRAAPETFVENTYQRFLVRTPNAYEEWFLVNKIQTDTTLTAELVWYAFLTCEEYRYY